MSHQKKINHKVTEAVKLDFKTQKIEAKSQLGAVSQLITMDGKVLIPFRGEYYVLEGASNLSDDQLKKFPIESNEEISIDL
jgi:hypothetical protein